MLKKILLVVISVLPSFLKRPAMRLLGYGVGKHVSVGFGSIILAEEVEIGDYVEIGAFSIMLVNKLKIGDYSKISVFCWFYGSSDVDIGRFCYIGPRSILNCEELIQLGDYSGLGPCCMLYTHGVFLPYTEGYPRKFEPIIIERKVWVPASVLILPGVRIGEGSIIGAGSVVNKSIPPSTFAAGNPCQVIKNVNELVSKVGKKEFEDRVRNIIRDLKTHKRGKEVSENCFEIGGETVYLFELPKDYSQPAILLADKVSRKNLQISWFSFNERVCMLRTSLAKEFYDFLKKYYGETFEIGKD